MRLFWAIALVSFVLGIGNSAKAETLRELPSCYDGFGDIWGEKSEQIRMREIDGGEISKISDFARITGTRDISLKVIKGGNFAGWDFSNTPLHQVCFDESDLKGANFSGAEGTGVGFLKSDLTGANMQDAVMPRIMFRNANLTDVNAANANFYGGHFDGGWFEGGVAGWNINGATMTEFVFECGITVPDGCPVYSGGKSINANGANFTRATLHSFGLYNVESIDATIDDTIVGPGQLTYLRGAKLEGSIILRGGNSDVSITADEVKTLLKESGLHIMGLDRASFDCSNARSKVELEICENGRDDLRLLDREVAELYKRAKAVDPKVKASQLAWLKQRNKCNAVEYTQQCISDNYSRRKGELLGLLGEADWLKKGEKALFVTENIPLSPEFRKRAFFRKITPALVGASMTEILVARDSNGLYSIKGSAVGANAHLCSLEASHLYLDKKTGWYIPVSEGVAMPIFRIFDSRLEVFESGRPDYEKYPDGGNYMSCGARAGFDAVMQIAVDTDYLDKVTKHLETQM